MPAPRPVPRRPRTRRRAQRRWERQELPVTAPAFRTQRLWQPRRLASRLLVQPARLQVLADTTRPENTRRAMSAMPSLDARGANCQLNRVLSCHSECLHFLGADKHAVTWTVLSAGEVGTQVGRRRADKQGALSVRE